MLKLNQRAMLFRTVSRFLSIMAFCLLSGFTAFALAQADPAPASYPDQPACKVNSVRQAPTSYENAARSPVSDLTAFTQLDSRGVYQVYVTGKDGGKPKCISCATGAGFPRLDRNKPMISWHPSGKWLVVGVEETNHDLMWMPASWKRGLLQSGIWLNIWLTTPSGDRWYQITDFNKKTKGPSDGYVGVAFTPDGGKAVWAEIVNGNVLANHFGVWKLYMADFVVRPDGTPSLVKKQDISPAGARWLEPGNFAPDGVHLLLSSDIGMKDAQGQDQFALDTVTGEVRNLTSSSTVWDEHGLYSPDGKKISFMSSYPYRREANSNKVASLKTEFMLMDSDGSHLQQITHFNVPGYPESQRKKTIAAVAGFSADGSQLFATVMSSDKSFTKTNWVITFDGPCGNSRAERSPRRAR